MKKNYVLVERIPTSKEVLSLRLAVNWTRMNLDALSEGMKNTSYGICAIADDEVIGYGRVIDDGKTVFYISEIIVHPDFQGLGIGTSIMEKMMDYIHENACNEAVVALMSAKGLENFYSKFGFEVRPNEKLGAGMTKFIKNK